jgi:hypothetical protein
MVIGQSSKTTRDNQGSADHTMHRRSAREVRRVMEHSMNDLIERLNIARRHEERLATFERGLGGVGLSPHASRNPDASRRPAAQLIELFPVFGWHRDASTFDRSTAAGTRWPSSAFSSSPHGITARELSYARVQSASLLENARDSGSGLHQDGLGTRFGIDEDYVVLIGFDVFIIGGTG